MLANCADVVNAEKNIIALNILNEKKDCLYIIEFLIEFLEYIHDAHEYYYNVLENRFVKYSILNMQNLYFLLYKNTTAPSRPRNA